ncbi:MAG: hypothetical protein HXS54_11370 [Theionarchaea archaeon]|nr:hypothetical protein [Theionarchaea archaeon]
MNSLIFTTVQTPSKEYLALPRTLTVEKEKGSGRIFLECTKTIFYKEWQDQAHTVFEFAQKLFSLNTFDFFISVDTKKLDGWSTSVPLFLLVAGLVTGEPLPKNLFSTGCMVSPDGFISRGNIKSTQAKIDALEALASSQSQTPLFIIPLSFHEYACKKVKCYPVASMLSALKIALPQTFHTYESLIENLVHVKSHLPGSILDHIPSGNVVVINSGDDTDSDTDSYSDSCSYSYLMTDSDHTTIVEEFPSKHPAHIYIICDRKVVVHHQYGSKKEALKRVPQYKRVITSLVF